MGDPDVCNACWRVFLEADDIRYYGEQQTGKSTLFSPPEWELIGPICGDCYVAPERDEDWKAESVIRRRS